MIHFLFIFILLIIQTNAITCKVKNLSFGSSRDFNDSSIYETPALCPCWSRDCVIDFSSIACAVTIKNISTTVSQFFIPMKDCIYPPMFEFNGSTSIETMHIGQGKITTIDNSFVSIII